MDKYERQRKLMIFIVDCGCKYFDLPKPLSRMVMHKGQEKYIIFFCIKRLVGTTFHSRAITKYCPSHVKKRYADPVKKAYEKKQGWVYDKYIQFEKYVLEELRKANGKT